METEKVILDLATAERISNNPELLICLARFCWVVSPYIVSQCLKEAFDVLDCEKFLEDAKKEPRNPEEDYFSFEKDLNSIDKNRLNVFLYFIDLYGNWAQLLFLPDPIEMEKDILFFALSIERRFSTEHEEVTEDELIIECDHSVEKTWYDPYLQMSVCEHCRDY